MLGSSKKKSTISYFLNYPLCKKYGNLFAQYRTESGAPAIGL